MTAGHDRASMPAMDPGDELTSCTLTVPWPDGLHRLLTWLRSRCGPEATDSGPAGSWCWSWVDGKRIVVTLPNPEVAFEMRLVQPWRP